MSTERKSTQKYDTICSINYPLLNTMGSGPLNRFPARNTKRCLYKTVSLRNRSGSGTAYRFQSVRPHLAHLQPLIALLLGFIFRTPCMCRSLYAERVKYHILFFGLQDMCVLEQGMVQISTMLSRLYLNCQILRDPNEQGVFLWIQIITLA